MKIVILGGGSFGTALAHQLAFNEKNKIQILLRNPKTENEINKYHFNSSYFPKRVLHNAIRATTTYKAIGSADMLFIAIPSNSIIEVISSIDTYLKKETLIINMSKSILKNGKTIVEYLKQSLNHQNVIAMKGASFSADMINCLPTLFSVGFTKKEHLEKVFQITKNTNIFLDYTTDIRGVELLSAIKNIYAIALGNIDAKYNSVNARFLIMTKAIEEIRILMRILGGKEESIFLSCGVGDMSLTGLNDLSRNRTLGLLIGKGFYDESLQRNSVVVEGKNTINIIDTLISDDVKLKLPLLNRVKTILAHPSNNLQEFSFQSLFKRRFKTVLTYGTFDLLHYGHLELLRRIREMGDRVIVGLSTDNFNKIKGKKCVMTYEKRKHLLEVLSYVDEVIPEENWNQKIDDIKNHNVDIFVMGNDWRGKFDSLNKYCEVKYLQRTKGISTTKLKAILNDKE